MNDRIKEIEKKIMTKIISKMGNEKDKTDKDRGKKDSTDRVSLYTEWLQSMEGYVHDIPQI